MKKSIALLALVSATALASTAVLAQTTTPPKGPDNTAGETSNRTPEKKTQAPLEQKDTVEGKTSDRSAKKDGETPHAGGVQPDHSGVQGEPHKK